MSEIFYVVPEEQHNALVAAVYRKRGYTAAEAADGARFCAEATPPRHPHPQRAQGAAPRPPVRLRVRRMRAEGEDRKNQNPLPRFRSLERQQKTRPGHRLRRHRGRHQTRRQIRRRHGFRGQRLPLPLGRRLRDGSRAPRLHRLHQLHRRARRSRPLRRQVPHPRHQPPLLGLPHHGLHRLSDRHRLGHLRRRHGPRATARPRRQTTPARRRRR